MKAFFSILSSNGNYKNIFGAGGGGGWKEVGIDFFFRFPSLFYFLSQTCIFFRDTKYHSIKISSGDLETVTCV